MNRSASTALLALLALLAFAANSLLTRQALGAREIDAGAFTLVRLAAGAVTLVIIAQARGVLSLRGSAIGPLSLFAYAAAFSFAYLRIGASVGALVLFGMVQLTMLAGGFVRGERPTWYARIGMLVALAGLAILTLPGAARPDLLGVALMLCAGAAWGIYSLAGRTAGDPVAANARSFFWGSLLAIPLLAIPGAGISSHGLALAVVSGAITSGLGYVIWYRALPGLSVTQAAVAQLAVPLIAAAGAAFLLHETLTPRFAVASATVLGGIALVLLSPR